MTSTSFEDAALEGPMALTLPGVFFFRFSGQRIFGRVFGCDDFAHGRMDLPIKKTTPDSIFFPACLRCEDAWIK